MGSLMGSGVRADVGQMRISCCFPGKVVDSPGLAWPCPTRVIAVQFTGPNVVNVPETQAQRIQYGQFFLFGWYLVNMNEVRERKLGAVTA